MDDSTGDDVPPDSDGMTGDAGDSSTIDTDGDGQPDTADNCPAIPDPAQRDHDGDYIFLAKPGG